MPGAGVSRKDIGTGGCAGMGRVDWWWNQHVGMGIKRVMGERMKKIEIQKSDSGEKKKNEASGKKVKARVRYDKVWYIFYVEMCAGMRRVDWWWNQRVGMSIKRVMGKRMKKWCKKVSSEKKKKKKNRWSKWEKVKARVQYDKYRRRFWCQKMRRNEARRLVVKSANKNEY
jgi:hypothetical protein